MPGQEWNDQQRPSPWVAGLLDPPLALDSAVVPIRADLDSALVRQRDSGDSWELEGRSGRRTSNESDGSRPSSRPEDRDGVGRGGMGAAVAEDPSPGRWGSGCPCTSGVVTDTRQRAGGTAYPAPVGTPFLGTAGSVLQHPLLLFLFPRPQEIS